MSEQPDSDPKPWEETWKRKANTIEAGEWSFNIAGLPNAAGALIAASPELYRALAGLVDAACQHYTSPMPTSLRDALLTAERVLAKARGEL